MLFNSQEYALFFATVLALYWATPRHRARVYLLLAASLFFYASWNRWLALLIAATSTLDYAVGLGIEAGRTPRVRKGLLILSLVANLGMLAAFKYANFFLGSLEAALHACGATGSLPVLRLILPVGISFYTFEAINYVVDVYRGRARAERDLPSFLLFITFFPHLVAGPIVRARDFLPQVRRAKRWDWPRAELGVGLFLMGLFKKLAIADRMALYVDPVFAHPESYGSHAAWIATVAYAIQIYCDFSGYTDMALGSAHLLGYKLAPNFQMPYLAANISDFWRRWHMSLSGWLRDYLFIPLGGSRGPGWKTSRNLLITMTLAGLWHGDRWTFVAWGALLGLALVVHRGFRAFCRPRLADAPEDIRPGPSPESTPHPNPPPQGGREPELLPPSVRGRGPESLPPTHGGRRPELLPPPLRGRAGVGGTDRTVGRALDSVLQTTGGTVLRVALTFLTVALGWVFFRAETFGQAGSVLRRLFVPADGLPTPLPTGAFWTLIAVVVAAHAIGSIRGGWRSISSRLPAPALGLGYAAALTLALLLAPDVGNVFIYFQF